MCCCERHPQQSRQRRWWRYRGVAYRRVIDPVRPPCSSGCLSVACKVRKRTSSSLASNWSLEGWSSSRLSVILTKHSRTKTTSCDVYNYRPLILKSVLVVDELSFNGFTMSRESTFHNVEYPIPILLVIPPPHLIQDWNCHAKEFLLLKCGM